MIIPISIIIRLIQELDILPYLSQILGPVMQLCGLPAETALVWITAIIVNIYGGILSLFSIYPSLSEPLTVAQLTVLLLMILLAHTFPIELKIAQKAGAKLWVMFLFRFLGALLFGSILSVIYSKFNLLQTPALLPETFITNAHPTWKEWILNELKNYAMIAVIIFLLVSLLRILELVGFITLLNKALHPLLKWIGISSDVLPITIIGLTLGIAYGGGLIIDECQHKKLPPKDIFYSLLLMGLFHSIIEDSFLMIGIGAHYSGIFIFRFLFAVLIVAVFVLLTKNIDETRFCKWFISKKYAKIFVKEE